MLFLLFIVLFVVALALGLLVGRLISSRWAVAQSLAVFVWLVVVLGMVLLKANETSLLPTTRDWAQAGLGLLGGLALGLGRPQLGPPGRFPGLGLRRRNREATRPDHRPPPSVNGDLG